MTFTENIKRTYPQLLATIIGCFMAVSDGMTAGWSSPMIPYFLNQNTTGAKFYMSHAQGEFMETINILGSASGLPFVLILVDKIGRKKSVILAAALGTVCWTTLIFVPNKELLYTARYFAGTAGDMCFVATPMYVAEIAEQSIRGFLSALIYIMMLVGIMVVYASGAYGPYWLPPVIGIILCGSEMLLFPFMPETPYFHISKGNLEEAKKSLQTLRAGRNIEAEFEEIKQAVEKEKAKKRSPLQALKELVTVPENLKGTIIMAFLNLSQHYSGITVLEMNVHPILEEAGSKLDSNAVAMMFSGIMIIGALTASVIIDKVGRKALLILSSVFSGTILASLAVYFHLKNDGHDVSDITWLPGTAIMVYALAFKLGLGIVPIVITAEIFGPSVKAVGMTVAEIFYIIGAVTSVSVYSFLSNNYGSHVPFYLFMSCAFFVTVFTIIYIPETKGKTLDEIQLKLHRGKSKSVNDNNNL